MQYGMEICSKIIARKRNVRYNYKIYRNNFKNK